MLLTMKSTLSQAEIPELLSVECDEPSGVITRHVRLLSLTPRNLKIFWEKARQHRTLFSKEIRDNFSEFLRVIVRQDSSGGIMPTGLFWIIDDFVGVFYLTAIRPREDALVHYTFFDGRHRGREKLCIEMLRMAFDSYGFRRLTAEIPTYAKPQVRSFVHNQLGFKGEGRKRKAAFFDNEWFDILIYGILKEELPDKDSIANS